MKSEFVLIDPILPKYPIHMGKMSNGQYEEGEYGDFSCLVRPPNLGGQGGWVGADHIFLVGA